MAKPIAGERSRRIMLGDLLISGTKSSTRLRIWGQKFESLRARHCPGARPREARWHAPRSRMPLPGRAGHGDAGLDAGAGASRSRAWKVGFDALNVARATWFSCSQFRERHRVRG